MTNSENQQEMPEEFKAANWPVLSEALMQRLNAAFPERSAAIEWEEKAVWFASGQRSVVRFLNMVFQEQNETVISKE